ncbi:MAG: tRNA (adenine(22)-N(1))-methyltransferase [Syntrophomonadales bacterium]
MASVADLVVTGEPMADIGSDHALLSCYLVGKGYCPWAVCGELGDGPYQRTLAAIRMNNLNNLIEVRQGNGLEVLAPGEVTTVVLAGMGGNTIIDILRRSSAKTQSFDRLVLQPMNALVKLRHLASLNGWRIEEETVVRDGDYYINLVLTPRAGPPYRLSETEMRWGPLLMHNTAMPVVREYYSYHLDKYNRIVKGIPVQSSERSQLQKKIYQKRIEELEGILR